MQRSIQSLIAMPVVVLAFNATDVVSSSAFAQSPASATHSKSTAIPEKKPDGTWESLSPSQQKILGPLESDWEYMIPDSRKKWIHIANIYPKMSAQDQERLQSRMTGWSNLSQKDRRIARENYLSSLKFPPEKKAEAWSAYQKLSDEQKKKLADQEAKRKPTATNAPTLQQHSINEKTTPPPPAPRPRSLPAESISTPSAPAAEASGNPY